MSLHIHSPLSFVSQDMYTNFVYICLQIYKVCIHLYAKFVYMSCETKDKEL